MLGSRFIVQFTDNFLKRTEHTENGRTATTAQSLYGRVPFDLQATSAAMGMNQASIRNQDERRIERDAQHNHCRASLDCGGFSWVVLELLFSNR